MGTSPQRCASNPYFRKTPVVELKPGAVAAMHKHPNEQVGLVIQGTIDFDVDGERRLLNAGDTYVIPANVSHEAIAGPEGCVVVDVFSPTRADWHRLESRAQQQPKWPRSPAQK